MATWVAPRPAESVRKARRTGLRRGRTLLLTGLLALLAVGVGGYHPFAEDGGVYGPGVRWLLDRRLYPVGTGFVTEHLRYSAFAWVVAWVVRVSGLGLETVLLAGHLLSVWAMLYAVWMVASRVYEGTAARWGVVGLVAAWLTLPVAGTSLLLMDPYLTGRSVSTPLVVMAMAVAMDLRGSGREAWRGVIVCGGLLWLAALMHPLMAGYGAWCVLVLVSLRAGTEGVRRWGVAACVLGALLAAVVVQARGAGETPEYLRVVATRPYWFLERWRWFEVVGVVAPIGILMAAVQGRWAGGRAIRDLAGAGVICGGTAVGIALGFARVDAVSHAVARMQPLRVFAMVYVVMIVILGGWLGGQVLGRRLGRWAMAFAVLGAVMLGVERRTYPATPHLELPVGGRIGGRANGWEEAFVWIRNKTPRDAVFALPRDYVTEAGEDAVGFRAVAERSALADFSKDGGEAAITPALAVEWGREQDALTGFETLTDADRARRLRPMGVGWVVFPRGWTTGFDCPFQNQRVRVCRLP